MDCNLVTRRPQRRAITQRAAAVVAAAAMTATLTAAAASAQTQAGTWRFAVAARQHSGPQTGVMWTSPQTHRHHISKEIAKRINETPGDATIQFSLYRLGVPRVYRAFKRAQDRGVTIQGVFNGGTRWGYPEGKALGKMLNHDGNPDSWVRFTDGSARDGNKDGIMHQKSYLFSETGGARWVTLLGSYNTDLDSDAHAYALMWRIVGKKAVYDAVQNVFELQSQLENMQNPYRAYSGRGWESYFLPADVRDAGHDPVMKRLRALPKNRNTHIRIAMYSMWDKRGTWISKYLAYMARRGVHVEFIAGPTVSWPVRSRMRRGGVRIYQGYWKADQTWTHSKDMSATWRRHGKRHYETWIGSDNWTSRSQIDDDAVIGMRGYKYFRQFNRYFERVRHHR